MNQKNGFSFIEIIVVLFTAIILGIFITPIIFNPAPQKQEAAVKANIRIGVSALRTEFALKSGKTPEEIALETAGYLNRSTKNPIDKDIEAFVVNLAFKGAVEFVPDNSKNLIVLKGYTEDILNPIIEEIVYAPDVLED